MPSRGPRDVQELIAEAAGLRRLAVRLVGESDADDVVHDAIAAGIEHAPRDERALRPWLARVLRNFAAGRHRSEGRRTAREADVARGESLPSASDLVARMEVQRIVAEEVLQLSDPYRRAVLAVYFEGTSAEEYARTLGVPSATVRSWLKRGLDALRTRLDRRFDGDRAAWSACLLPLVRPEVALAPLAFGGGILMKNLVAVAAVLLLALCAAWWWSPGSSPRTAAGSPSRRPEPIDAAPAALGALPPAATGDLPTQMASERAAIPTPMPARASVAGTVTWTPDGALAVDVGVRLTPQLHDSADGASPQSFTDRDGRFRFEGVEPGVYRLHLDRSTVSAKVRVQAGELLEVPMPAPRGTDIVGRVLDRDGAPVPGAEVHMRESNSAWTRLAAIAGPDGAYRVESVDRWTSFFARAPGRAPSGVRQATQDTQGTIDLYLGGATGRITGRVVGPERIPVVGALVRFVSSRGHGVDPAGNLLMGEVGREVRTGASGEFEFLDVEPGNHKVHASSAGCPRVRAAVDVQPGSTTALVLEFPRTARVRGRVTDESGTPLEGARILVAARGRQVSESIGSDAGGRFDTGCAPSGAVRLVVSHESGLEDALEMDLAPGADFEWSPVIRAFHPIRGRLVDLAGRPLASRPIALSAHKRTATTDGEGRFVFDGLREQAYGLSFTEGSLSARADGVVPGVEEVLLVAEVPSARIVGRLVDAEGKPVGGVRLECDRSIVQSQADGAFDLPRIRSGVHRIGLWGTALQSFALATLEVQAGALHDVGSLVVPGSGSLSVRVRSDEGVPIGWTRPVVRRVGHADAYLSQRGWNERGTWVVPELPAGEYELGVRDGGAALQLWPFSIRAGERTELEADLRFGSSLDIEILARAGARPLRDAEIEIVGSDGALVGREAWRSAKGTPSATVPVTLAPGSYDLVARTQDGRSGRTRAQVPPRGGRANPVRIDLR